MDASTRAALNAALTRLSRGERGAADTVFSSLWPVLRAFCSRVVRTSGAEDVAQAALMKVFEQASRFDSGRDALAWALEIALWECRTELRRQGRSRETAWVPAAETVSDEARSPSEVLEGSELRAALDAALERLSELDRETLRAVLSETTGPVEGATWRKRKERAMRRLELLWRTVYGAE